MTDKALPVDRNWHPITVLKLSNDVSRTTVTDSSSRIALPTEATANDIIRVATNTDCYIALGDDTVTASSNSTLFLAGVEYISLDKTHTHLAVIRDGEDGVLTVTEVY